MRLRNKIGAAVAAVTLTGVAMTGVMTWWRVSRTIREEADREVTGATRALMTEWRGLGNDVSARLARAAQLPSMRNGLNRLARGDVPAESGEIIGLAARALPQVNLDFLQIFDERGRVLSNGHWQVFYGRSDAAGWEIARRSGPDAAAHWREVKGRRIFALESSVRFEAGARDFTLVGGRAIGTEVVDDLIRRSSGTVYVNLRDGSRILPDGVATSDLEHLLDAQRVEVAGLSFVVGRPALSESDKVSLLPIRGPDGKVIGDFVLRISQAPLVHLAQELSITFVVVGALGVVMAWVIGFWTARRITRPIEKLAVAAGRVGVGRTPGEMPPVTDDEVGDLVRSFQHMTADLAESRRELVRAERLATWREIAQRMAHEIKNALSPIQISVETVQRSRRLKHAEFDQILDESVETVREEVLGLRNLVNEFSQFARMPELALAHGALNPVVERAVNLHEKNPAGVRIVETLAPGLPEILLDAEALGRAIGNIILNAVEASPSGGQVRVTSAPQADGGVEIQIDDQGSGIPATERERIFEPYYTTKTSGTGLGLAMAWKIVSEHGGRIEIDEAPGGGARFRLMLPVAPAAGRRVPA